MDIAKLMSLISLIIEIIMAVLVLFSFLGIKSENVPQIQFLLLIPWYAYANNIPFNFDFVFNMENYTK